MDILVQEKFSGGNVSRLTPNNEKWCIVKPLRIPEQYVCVDFILRLGVESDDAQLHIQQKLDTASESSTDVSSNGNRKGVQLVTLRDMDDVE